jgi:hypothetical protein
LARGGVPVHASKDVVSIQEVEHGTKHIVFSTWVQVELIFEDGALTLQTPFGITGSGIDFASAWADLSKNVVEEYCDQDETRRTRSSTPPS